MASKNVQRIFGMLIMLVSLYFIYRQWFTAANEGFFYAKASMIFPVFFFLGVSKIALEMLFSVTYHFSEFR